MSIEHVNLLTVSEIRLIRKSVADALQEFNGTRSLEEVADDATARIVVFVNIKLRSVQ